MNKMSKKIATLSLLGVITFGAIVTSCKKENIQPDKNIESFSINTNQSMEFTESVRIYSENNEYFIDLKVESDKEQGLKDMIQYYSSLELNLVSKEEALINLNTADEAIEKTEISIEESYNGRITMNIDNLSSQEGLKGKMLGFRELSNTKTLSGLYSMRPKYSNISILFPNTEKGILLTNKTRYYSSGCNCNVIGNNAYFACTYPLGSNQPIPPWITTPAYDGLIMDYNEIYDLNPVNHPLNYNDYGITAISMNYNGGYPLQLQYYLYL